MYPTSPNVAPPLPAIASISSGFLRVRQLRQRPSSRLFGRFGGKPLGYTRVRVSRLPRTVRGEYTVVRLRGETASQRNGDACAATACSARSLVGAGQFKFLSLTNGL